MGCVWGNWSFVIFVLLLVFFFASTLTQEAVNDTAVDFDTPPFVTEFVTCAERYCQAEQSEQIPGLPTTCQLVRDGHHHKFKYDSMCHLSWRDLLQNGSGKAKSSNFFGAQVEGNKVV